MGSQGPDEQERLTSNERTDAVDRRDVLKGVGAGIGALGLTFGGSDVVRAASAGYGEGGYGEGLYGGSSTVVVATDEPTDVRASSARLNGSLSDLGGLSTVDCHFQWRAVGENDWNETPARSYSSTGDFSVTITGLSESTKYEYRARGTDEGSGTVAGELHQYTTRTRNASPRIKSFDVSTDGPSNSISVNWYACDVDADLDTVSVNVYRSFWSRVDSKAVDVSGAYGCTSGQMDFDVGAASGETFLVFLTVEDENGYTAFEAKTVTA